jgi:hypothetical protein
MIERLPNGNLFITKGTPIPYLCPKCDAIVPYVETPRVQCWACGYEADAGEFDDIEFVPRVRQ